MRTDYTATYWRDTRMLEVDDGHDNQVFEIACTENRIADAMRDAFGALALHIPVEVWDDIGAAQIADHIASD